MKKRSFLEMALILIAALMLMLGNAVDWKNCLESQWASSAELGSLADQ